MGGEETDPDRRKRNQRSADPRPDDGPAAKLAAPSGQGFSISEAYVQRQFIVVVPSEVSIVEREALAGLQRNASANERADALLDAVDASESAAGISSGLDQIIRGVMALREAGVELRMVSAIDAAEQLSLPPGHPFHGLVYVGHPGVPNLYYPMGEFHQRVFEHKFSEALDLLMMLGASQLTVELKEGSDRKEAQGVAAAFNAGGGVVNPSTGFRPRADAKPANLASDRIFEASFPGSNDPRIPKGMVWWTSERSWQTLARARVRYRTAEFSLTVRYENDYGVDDELRSRIEATKLDIGGRFHRQVDTVWKLNATFPGGRASAADVTASDDSDGDVSATGDVAAEGAVANGDEG